MAAGVQEIQVVLIGNAGSGKSSLINFLRFDGENIAGRVAITSNLAENCTKFNHENEYNYILPLKYGPKECIIVDTPGFHELDEKTMLIHLIRITALVALNKNIVFLFVLKGGRLNYSEYKLFKILKQKLGSDFLKRFVLVFNHFDEEYILYEEEIPFLDFRTNIFLKWTNDSMIDSRFTKMVQRIQRRSYNCCNLNYYIKGKISKTVLECQQDLLFDHVINIANTSFDIIEFEEIRRSIKCFDPEGLNRALINLYKDSTIFDVCVSIPILNIFTIIGRKIYLNYMEKKISDGYDLEKTHPEYFDPDFIGKYD